MTENNALTGGGLSDETQVVTGEVEEKNADFLRLQFTDILRTMKNVSIPASQAEEAFAEGIYFDSSSIDGLIRIQESDIRLEPGPSMFVVLPWRKKENSAAGRLICDVLNTSINGPFSGNPHDVLRHAIEHAKKLGYDVNVAPESGFSLFKEDRDGHTMTITNDAGSYFDLTPEDLTSDVRHDIIYGLENVNFGIETSYHEVAEDQHEISFTYDDALSMAGNVATFRSVAHAIAIEHDLRATLIPKPIPRISGSGMYVHVSLFKDGENTLHNDNNEFDLSDTVKSFVVGVLDHVPAIMVVTDPMVSSYKCLVLDYEAPVCIAWPDCSRSAFIHRPATRTPATSRIETHFPDPSCNPYLALAALVYAGLDGVEKGLDCPDPVRGDVYEFDEAEREKYDIEALPKDLGGAADVLKEDEVIQEAPDDHVFGRLIEVKCSELKDYFIDVSQWELSQCLETL